MGFIVLSFTIWGGFPPFRLLGCGVIFRHSIHSGFGVTFRCSVIVSFHLLVFEVVFRCSTVPSFCLLVFRLNFGPFHDSAVPSFHCSGPGCSKVG